MDQNTKVCTYCGAVCDKNDVCCPQCLQNFSKESISEETVFEGTDNKTVKTFIGKNSNYYLKKFAKAKDKKIFLQLNVAALLFGSNWFFYRKMYKTAILFSAVSILFSSVLLLCVSSVFKSDVDRYFADKQAYTDYVNSDVEKFVWDEAGNLNYNEEYDHSKYDNLERSRNKIETIDFFRFAPVLLLDIFFRLLGNCFYKRHVISNIKINNTSGSGTSGVSAIIGAVATFTADIIVTILVLCIPTVFRFMEATGAL